MTFHTPLVTATPSGSRAVLLIDDEPGILEIVGELLERRGWHVITPADGRTGIEVYERERPELVMLDVAMPGLSGLRVLEILRERDPDATVVMLSGAGDVATAVESMQLGAENFLVKPLVMAEFTVVVERASEKAVLRRRNRILATRQVRDSSLSSLGQSPIMREVARQIELLAGGNAPILLSGETGSGKGWVSKLIHAASPRGGAPFISLNCAGLSAAFLDTELFGHEKGAFTDAKSQKLGLFEIANGGTLMLDEIGDLALELQPKLLTVLETQRFRRLGGTREVKVDVRLIAASHVDLSAAVKAGRFREDLFYRIAALPLYVPSLRERGSAEIAELTLQLLSDLRRQLGRGPETVSANALGVIVNHGWPGNIRELRNVLERALLLAAGDAEVDTRHLPAEIRPARSSDEPLPDDLSMAAAELRHIKRVLAIANGNRVQAARLLGMSRQTLYNRLKESELGDE